MIWWHMAASPVVGDGPGSFAFDLNSLISGMGGAGLLALFYWIIKLILDRTIPSRSDARANVTLVLEGLSNMVKVLQEEKIADSARLTAKQARIDILEAAADKDYLDISELRSEIIELRGRLAQKDRHINTLVMELRKLGAKVTGVEIQDEESLEILLPTTGEVRRIGHPSTTEADITGREN